MKTMFICSIALSVLIMPFFQPSASGCNVCHSKNPKMVRMHTELEFKDCFNCHYPGARKSPEEQKVRMVTDNRCVSCHKK